MADVATRAGYARLPEDLLRDLLDGAPDVVEQVRDLLGSALDKRDEIRAALERLNLIRQYEPVDSQTACGVDGGFAVERTAAVDLVLAVAVGVEGLATETTGWEGTQYEWWSRVAKHDLEAERLARGVMVAQELKILRDAPHECRILDGSHLTPVIQLNSALTAISDDIREEARSRWTELETVEALSYMARDKAVVAMPKYDSSTSIVRLVSRELNEEIPGDDKLILSLVLGPGELVLPQRMPNHPWGTLHFTARSPADEEVAGQFAAAIEPLTMRELAFTYFKPDELSPAFRLEVKTDLPHDALDRICSTLVTQMTGPFVREPYPQYLADVMAKSVGLGLSALQSAAQFALSQGGRPEIAEMLVHSYRTEGV